MPLVIPSGPPQKPRTQNQVIAAPSYRGVTVDTKQEPVDNLLSHIEGSSWTVNYYSQVIDLDSQIAGQQMSTNPVHQQYKLIRHMELKVSAALSAAQNTDTNNMDVTGSATVYPFVIPNVGDMFIADTGAGREGIFEITASERKSIFKAAVHEIRYVLTGYSADRLADLNQKVVSTFEFDREFIKYGQNPLVFEEEHQIVIFLRQVYKRILHDYVKAFRSVEFGTFLVPGQSSPCTDIFMTRFIMQNFDAWDTDDLRRVRQYNVQDDYALRAMQILEAITRRDITLLRDCFTTYGTVDTKSFTSDPMLEGIYYSGVYNVIYPTDPTLTVDYNLVTPPKLPDSSPLDAAPPKLSYLYELLAPSQRNILSDALPDFIDGFTSLDSNGNPIVYPTQPPLVHRAMAGGSYIFSPDFYANTQVDGAQSVLELLVRDFLVGNALNNARLKALILDMPNWNAMDRFYYTPIVLLLTKASVRSV
jgi:hypothetical protein